MDNVRRETNTNFRARKRTSENKIDDLGTNSKVEIIRVMHRGISECSKLRTWS